MERINLLDIPVPLTQEIAEKQRQWREALEVLEELEFVGRAIETMDAHPDKIIKISCFNKEEAQRIEAEILRRRPDLRGRFFTTWLSFFKRER